MSRALELDYQNVASLVDQKVILITGGSGSFGQKLITILFKYFTPKAVIVYSRDEFKQHNMIVESGFTPDKYPNLRFVIGDVRNYTRLYETLRDHSVNLVFHTAAIKHVNFAELNPDECIATNITGTSNLVKACQNVASVEKVLALSTDKCVDPINIYGASKLCLERLVIVGNNFYKMKELGIHRPIFAVARYGNVLGSRGSVIHVFDKQIRDGTIKIMNSEMTRFTLLKEEAVNFALNSMSRMIGGEVFVPILPSYNIRQLARVMSPETPINIVGLRPGEKLHECMISRHESHLAFKILDSDFYVIRHHYFKDYVDYFNHYTNIQECDHGWSYTSNNNGVLDDSKLKKLIDIARDEIV